MKATRKQHTLDEVIRSLSAKKDCKFADTGKQAIFILTKGSAEEKKDLGNKSWGKIDYLVHYCGFMLFRVDSFNQKKLASAFPAHFYQQR